MPKGKWADKQGDGMGMIDEVVEEIAATLGEGDESVISLRELLEDMMHSSDQMQDILYDLDRS